MSRSIKHFCDLYENAPFPTGQKELVAIREAIRLDSALGRALVSILLVFAADGTGRRPGSARGKRSITFEGTDITLGKPLRKQGGAVAG